MDSDGEGDEKGGGLSKTEKEQVGLGGCLGMLAGVDLPYAVKTKLVNGR